jgi:hypothetical protein
MKMKVSDVLRDESCWTKESYARDKDGFHISYDDPAACKFCIHGAVYRVCGMLGGGNIWQKLEEARKKLFPDSIGLINFNDRPETTFEDVKKVLAEANV